jgi:glycine/D-amino acid oxidase-like deaminating enzyme
MDSSPAQPHPGPDHAAAAALPQWLAVSDLEAPLPSETDVLVVGGGIIGTALAYYLAREGVSTVLVERRELNGEASGTNAGSFHLQIAIHQLTGFEVETVAERLLPEIRLYVEAAKLWHELERELQGPLEMHVTGGLMVAETAEQLQLLHDKQRIEQQAGLETHVLAGEELRAFAPYLAEDLTGATFCPLEGHANPLYAAPLYALRAAGAGAAIRTHADLIAVDAGSDGAFTAQTSRGPIRARRIVNAAGAWAGEVAELCGLSLPLRREGLHVNVTEPRERYLEPLVQHIGRRLTLKQSLNNTFIIGGGWPARPQPAPARYATVWESAAGNAAVAVRVVPRLADVRVVRTWSGVMAFTDDLSPIVGESRTLPGYFSCVATTGFTLGPLMARLLAEQMTSAGSNSPLPAEFSPDRAPASQPART